MKKPIKVKAIMDNIDRFHQKDTANYHKVYDALMKIPKDTLDILYEMISSSIKEEKARSYNEALVELNKEK